MLCKYIVAGPDRVGDGYWPGSQPFYRRAHFLRTGQARLKRVALYMRVPTVDQHPETQLLDLRQMAAQRGYEIVAEYTDKISGTRPNGQASIR